MSRRMHRSTGPSSGLMCSGWPECHGLRGGRMEIGAVRATHWPPAAEVCVAPACACGQMPQVVGGGEVPWCPRPCFEHPQTRCAGPGLDEGLLGCALCARRVISPPDHRVECPLHLLRCLWSVLHVQMEGLVLHRAGQTHPQECGPASWQGPSSARREGEGNAGRPRTAAAGAPHPPVLHRCRPVAVAPVFPISGGHAPARPPQRMGGVPVPPHHRCCQSGLMAGTD
mmetsp:Transcript_12972/g.23614  ORF Transcript_12972/g.23614 Transcript_12972/m.23614 type:complete len:227 (+) Transcript_12972:618-1298(+)|eukprot:CAMPEP_0174297754 /NCGR_PEP_ID=MMETSP0809-20121228/51848_1 /TAXON_ID=73025 ORGANISM="Eutreptiella gymnastica-like, Strain CCMP1594" /NCGR_SAMPLE_ID=MMETSP0809 /ASSEMBLY_ACC=CAM_ASM_000658 /LENGTH=226 /DNA_ID=CAMNT_0015401739 /DNA_START=583 /DNA_END=1263 /DNA_ORIENTATION=-